ncbi:MAG: LptA/OstA family protein [Desulfosalsimonadaceae bacterium]
MAQNFRNNMIKALFAGLLILWPCIFYLQPAACAEPAAGQNSASQADKVHVRADKLVSLRESNYIHFIGNVDLEIENTRIQSDDLKAYYKQMPKEGRDMGGKNIEKIVATGNVRIDMEKRRATCEKAVYRTKTQRLVLTGESVKIKSEGNLISGGKVTFNRKTGEITVDGDTEQRVNAVIDQGGNDLMSPQPQDEAQ